MNTEWPCKRCGRKFGADLRQFRIGYFQAPAVAARIEYIECQDPNVGGVIGLAVTDHRKIPWIPEPTRGVLQAGARLGPSHAGPAWYCEDCFKKDFPYSDASLGVCRAPSNDPQGV